MLGGNLIQAGPPEGGRIDPVGGAAITAAPKLLPIIHQSHQDFIFVGHRLVSLPKQGDRQAGLGRFDHRDIVGPNQADRAKSGGNRLSRLLEVPGRIDRNKRQPGHSFTAGGPDGLGGVAGQSRLNKLLAGYSKRRQQGGGAILQPNPGRVSLVLFRRNYDSFSSGANGKGSLPSKNAAEIIEQG